MVNEAPSPSVPDVRGCLGKHRFPTEATAEKRKNELWFERHVALRVYACTNCGGYHLTSQRGKAPVGPNFGPPKRPYEERRKYQKRNRGRR